MLEVFFPCVSFPTYCRHAVLCFHVVCDVFCHLLFIYIADVLISVNDVSGCFTILCLKRNLKFLAEKNENVLKCVW